MNTIKRFDAYMTLSSPPAADIDRIVKIFSEQGLEIQIHDNVLEFSFEGRDLSQNVIKSFLAVASILQDTEGELRCEVDDESDDPHFEFFTISNSKLWRQEANIVRGRIEEVSPT